MTTDSREKRYLDFILQSIEHIRSYLPSDAQSFFADSQCQDAVAWRLQSIADAARNHLSDDLKAHHPEINWTAVYGFRNIAAHQYAEINLDLVWEIATTHLDQLAEVARAEVSRH